MRRDNAAEFLLGLVATPGSAASTIGDLSEEAAARGGLWFWSEVLQTFYSRIGRDLSAFPLRMLWLGLWAWLTLNILFVLIAASVIVVNLMTAKAARASASAWPQWAGAAMAIIAVAVLIGWLLARRSQGREVAAVIAATSLFSILAGSAAVAALILPRMGVGPRIVKPGVYLQLPPAWPLLVLRITGGVLVPLLIGWLLARRSEGRELAAAAAAISVSASLESAMRYFLFRALPATSPLEFVSGFLFLLIGAVLFRRSHAKHPGGFHAT